MYNITISVTEEEKVPLKRQLKCYLHYVLVLLILLCESFLQNRNAVHSKPFFSRHSCQTAKKWRKGELESRTAPVVKEVHISDLSVRASLICSIKSVDIQLNKKSQQQFSGEKKKIICTFY